MELKSLLLDLDGTLVDTAPDMVGALNRVLKAHDCATADFNVASKLVSNGGRALIIHGFGDNLSDATIDQLVKEFLQSYQEHVADQSQIYSGFSELLRWCEANEILWGVITNKPFYLAEPLLHELGLLENCSILLGGDSLEKKKPHPAPLLHTCMQLNLAPSECLYVGDHERDIEAGMAAGMDTAVALWGYIQDTQKPGEWGAKYLLNSTDGLATLLQERLENNDREHG